MFSFWVLLATSLQAFAATVLINGAGATFPYPIYSKWFSDFRAVDQSAQINYNSIGSGGGIKQFLETTVDFGATDAPMTDEELAKAKTPVLHVPTVLGAVVVSYNIPGVKETVKLTPDVLVEVLVGKITKWSDPKIAALNPGVNFPKDLGILVVYRSDGSGTTAIFTDYLAKASSTWKSQIGAGKTVKWPVGVGGKGNEGVTGVIKQTPGALGYVELVYAKTNQLPTAAIKNKSGQFVEASLKTVTAAAQGALKAMPEDFRVSITNSEGKDSYPISGFTYLLIYQKMPREKGEKLVAFMKWALSSGQKSAEELHYATLPKPLVQRIEKRLLTVQYN